MVWDLKRVLFVKMLYKEQSSEYMFIWDYYTLLEDSTGGMAGREMERSVVLGYFSPVGINIGKYMLVTKFVQRM